MVVWIAWKWLEIVRTLLGQKMCCRMDMEHALFLFCEKSTRKLVKIHNSSAFMKLNPGSLYYTNDLFFILLPNLSELNLNVSVIKPLASFVGKFSWEYPFQK